MIGQRGKRRGSFARDLAHGVVIVPINPRLLGGNNLLLARVKRALPYVKPEDVIIAPDCGMKYLPRDVAYGKMRAMVEAAKLLRKEYGGD